MKAAIAVVATLIVGLTVAVVFLLVRASPEPVPPIPTERVVENPAPNFTEQAPPEEVIEPVPAAQEPIPTPRIMEMVGSCVSTTQSLCGDEFEWMEGAEGVLERAFNCGPYQCEVTGAFVAFCMTLPPGITSDITPWAGQECEEGATSPTGERVDDDGVWTCPGRRGDITLTSATNEGAHYQIALASGIRGRGAPYSERLPVQAFCGMPGSGGCLGPWTMDRTLAGFTSYSCARGAPVGDFGNPSLRSYIDGEREAALDVVVTVPASGGARMDHLTRMRALIDSIGDVCDATGSASVLAMQSGIPSTYQCEGSMAELEILTDASSLNRDQQIRIRFCETAPDCAALRRTSNRTGVRGL